MATEEDVEGPAEEEPESRPFKFPLPLFACWADMDAPDEACDDLLCFFSRCDDEFVELVGKIVIVPSQRKLIVSITKSNQSTYTPAYQFVPASRRSLQK